MRKLKTRFLKLFGRTELLMLYSLRRHSFLADVGWFKSWAARLPMDRNENPLPWFTYPAINFLERRLKPDMTVYEYGCGNSTYWWAARVNTVFSCEHDPDWFKVIAGKLPGNVQLELHQGERYVEAINATGRRFDVIVIDGRQRVKCIKACVPALKENGVIVVDNSDLPEYREGLDFLRNTGFKEIDFDGPGPVTPGGWRTSIFYHPGANVFDI